MPCFYYFTLAFQVFVYDVAFSIKIGVENVAVVKNVIQKNIEPKNGDIGAFMINDTEATVKYLDTIAGKKYLIPANKNYENFEVNENTQPIGKVVSLFRDI